MQGVVVAADLAVAGVPSLVATDPTGSRVAVADYDRAVRMSGISRAANCVAQIDLPECSRVQIQLAAGGDVRSALCMDDRVCPCGVSSRPQRPLLAGVSRDGDWQLVFAPSGASVLAGRSDTGYQTYRSRDGKLLGPPIGLRPEAAQQVLLAYSQDEQVIFTGNPDGVSRFWRATEIPGAAEIMATPNEHAVWQPSADNVMLALPGAQGFAIGDSNGHVHILPVGAGSADVDALREDVSFIGHYAEVLLMRADRAGNFVASVAEDNSIRIWDTTNGQPLPFMPEVEGGDVIGLSFSPDAGLLAVLQSASLTAVGDDGRIHSCRA